MRNNDLYYTLYEEEFNTQKYLYHYTSFLTAIKIIQGDSLRFSMLNHMNDTLESKPKAIVSQDYKEYGSKVHEIINCLKNLNLQLLCFSRDGEKHRNNNDDNIPDIIKYSDYIGRGFALPRMWAQYAQNNSGLCLIFNKKKLENIIKDILGTRLISHGKVKYVSRFGTYMLDNNEINRLINGYSDPSDMAKLGILIDFMKNNINFIKYNYFSKLTDWSGENEYRFLAWGDEKIYIRGICDALEAVVVGEDMGEPEIDVVKFITQNKCSMMKITFTSNGALVNRISNEL